MATIETSTGVGLVVSPSNLVPLLIDGVFDSASARVVGRVAGIALLALGVACWFAHDGGIGREATGLVAAMLLYNTGVVTILIWAKMGLDLAGVAFWPALILHAFISGWCVMCLRSQ